MKGKHSLLLAALAVMLAPSLAGAQSLKMKQYQKAQEETLKPTVESMNSKCGTTIEASIDWPSYKEADMDTRSASGFCEDAMSSLGSICDTPEGKRSVAKDVKKVVCKFGSARSVSLEAGTLTYTIDWEAANNTDYLKEFLMNKL